MFSRVFKGAPMGNKNAAGPHKVSSQSLKKHPMNSDSDLKYLKGKGYSNEKIKELWDRDHAGGESPVQHKKAPDIVGVLGNPNFYKSTKGDVMFAKALKGEKAVVPPKVETPVVQKSANFDGMLGTQAQHGLAMKKEAQAKVQTTATSAKKNERPTSGWAGDLGLGCLRK